jgi:hypothetical protein
MTDKELYTRLAELDTTAAELVRTGRLNELLLHEERIADEN